MDYKELAQETLCIQKQGWYMAGDVRVDITAAQRAAEERSVRILPEEGLSLLERQRSGAPGTECASIRVTDDSTVQAVLDLRAIGADQIGVLNFASAKNPGGGFLNGAMAQEESLAASSGLYLTQTRQGEYYRANRECGTMCYTHNAIYSPDTVFFRDGSFHLLQEPVTASVLTLPAVNFGQVLQRREELEAARRVMRERMELALAIFAEKGDRNLVLGAYGCGVFRNDPQDVASWWKELLEKGYNRKFVRIVFAILDHSRSGSCLRAFRQAFPEEERG